mmetsp:Transcript_30132/g.67548  ORF Transcript_30132/g.67548 Transcript_30132/m.67548 type:complete len:247 (+) Transcript_30132:410-1150(+)
MGGSMGPGIDGPVLSRWKPPPRVLPLWPSMPAPPSWTPGAVTTPDWPTEPDATAWSQLRQTAPLPGGGRGAPGAGRDWLQLRHTFPGAPILPPIMVFETPAPVAGRLPSAPWGRVPVAWCTWSTAECNCWTWAASARTAGSPPAPGVFTLPPCTALRGRPSGPTPACVSATTSVIVPSGPRCCGGCPAGGCGAWGAEGAGGAEEAASVGWATPRPEIRSSSSLIFRSNFSTSSFSSSASAVSSRSM